MTDLVERLLTPLHIRIGDANVGTEAFYIIEAMDIEAAEAAERIEELERQLATMTEKAIVGEYMWTPAELHDAVAVARRGALEEAAQYHDDLANQHEASRDESDHHAMMLRLHRRFAAAIRALSDSTPTPLQEQKANSGKEDE